MRALGTCKLEEGGPSPEAARTKACKRHDFLWWMKWPAFAMNKIWLTPVSQLMFTTGLRGWIGSVRQALRYGCGHVFCNPVGGSRLSRDGNEGH